MMRVFIYGDSNVWGENLFGPRIPYHQRWVNRLKRLARGKYEIIANGISGRTAGDYRLDKPECSGQINFANAYSKAKPIDITIIALGTNDFQQRFNRSIDNILNDLLWYKNTINKDSKIIYLLPPKFDTAERSGPEFTIESLTKRNEIIKHKEKLGDCIIVDDVELSDGVHFSAKGHATVANIVVKILETEI